jgi:hypothetical protein
VTLGNKQKPQLERDKRKIPTYITVSKRAAVNKYRVIKIRIYFKVIVKAHENRYSKLPRFGINIYDTSYCTFKTRKIMNHPIESVADPECLFRILDPKLFHPGSKFFPSRIRIRNKEFKYFNQKSCF